MNEIEGHCLTKDTYHLERGVKVLGGELDYPEGKESLFILARNINDFMPRRMFTLFRNGLTRAGKSLKGSKIALLGWAFLANFDDAQNTPSQKNNYGQGINKQIYFKRKKNSQIHGEKL